MFGISAILGIDLGNRSIKAVRLDKKGDAFVLTRLATLNVGGDTANISPTTEEILASQLKQIFTLVKPAGAAIHITVNSVNSTIRYVDLPQHGLEELRSAMKINSSTFLRQNFENYIFDICPLDEEGKTAILRKVRKGQPAPSANKVKALVGGISSSEASLFYHSLRRVGFRPASLQLAPVSVINSFEAAHPNVFKHQPISLMEVGYLSSSMTILEKGVPLLTRSVPIGGKHISDYMAQVGGMDFAKAEASKNQDSPIFREAVSRICVNLIREARSSINFFEKNSDLPIPRIHVTGGSVLSKAVVETLSNDIGTPCETWDPTVGLSSELPPDQQEVLNNNLSMFSSVLGLARSAIPQAPSKAKPVEAVATPTVAATPENPPASPAA